MNTEAASIAEVAAAADRLMGAFAAHEVADYFASFAPDATFLFHNVPELMRSKAEYQAEWAGWEADGFRVLACETHSRNIDMITPDVAVMTHRVRTWLVGVDEVQCERETIVFRRDSDGTWLGVHEHLSPETMS